jgi:hypothetical protein
LWKFIQWEVQSVRRRLPLASSKDDDEYEDKKVRGDDNDEVL